MPRVTDRALLLGRTPWSESSLVVHALTARHGPIRCLARGAYRRTSRLYCKLDLFDTLELTWRPPRNGFGLGELAEAEVTTRRLRPRRDLDAYEAGLTGLELAGLAARPGENESGLFDLLERALDALEDPRRRPALVLVRFELAYLDELGITPALEACAACGGAAPAGDTPADSGGPRVAFSAGAGGRLCTGCAVEARRSGRRVGSLPVRILEAAAALRGGSPPPAAQEDELVPRLRDFVGRFLESHLDQRPRTHRRFLARANRNAPAKSS